MVRRYQHNSNISPDLSRTSAGLWCLSMIFTSPTDAAGAASDDAEREQRPPSTWRRTLRNIYTGLGGQTHGKVRPGEASKADRDDGDSLLTSCPSPSWPPTSHGTCPNPTLTAQSSAMPECGMRETKSADPLRSAHCLVTTQVRRRDCSDFLMGTYSACILPAPTSLTKWSLDLSTTKWAGVCLPLKTSRWAGSSTRCPL